MPLVFIVFVFIVINYFVHFWSSDTFFVMASGGSGKVTPQGRGSRRLTLQGSLAAVGTSSKFANEADREEERFAKFFGCFIPSRAWRCGRGAGLGSARDQIYCDKANIFTERSGRGILVDVGPSCASANHRLKWSRTQNSIQPFGRKQPCWKLLWVNRAARVIIKADNTNVICKDKVCADFFAEGQCAAMLVEWWGG